jgi:HAD superfamily hydrolase (TIGR01490 family)
MPASGIPRVIHIFDIDYTIIKKPSTLYFLLEALEKKVIGFSRFWHLPFEWLRYRLGLPNHDFIEEAVKRLAGIKKTVMEETACSAFEKRTKAGIYREAEKLIRDLKSRGERICFATSSIDIIIKPLEDYFGIHESLATSLEFLDGKASGKIIGQSFFGPKKKTAVESWLADNSLKTQDLRFYSDSYTDIPLLEFCGQAVAVNPDSFLAKEARKRGWEILRFE